MPFPLVEPFFSFSPSALGDTAQGTLLLPPLESSADSMDQPVGHCLEKIICSSVRSPPGQGLGLCLWGLGIPGHLTGAVHVAG